MGIPLPALILETSSFKEVKFFNNFKIKMVKRNDEDRAREERIKKLLADEERIRRINEEQERRLSELTRKREEQERQIEEKARQLREEEERQKRNGGKT